MPFQENAKLSSLFLFHKGAQISQTKPLQDCKLALFATSISSYCHKWGVVCKSFLHHPLLDPRNKSENDRVGTNDDNHLLFAFGHYHTPKPQSPNWILSSSGNYTVILGLVPRIYWRMTLILKKAILLFRIQCTNVTFTDEQCTCLIKRHLTSPSYRS